jgi:hypothetical protein
VGANRVAADGADHVGANAVAANGQPERGLASDGSDQVGAGRTAAKPLDHMNFRELAGEMDYDRLTK